MEKMLKLGKHLTFCIANVIIYVGKEYEWVPKSLSER